MSTADRLQAATPPRQRPGRRVAAVIVTGVLTIALGLAAFMLLRADGGPLPDGVAARVGDNEITRQALDRAVDQAILAGSFPADEQGEPFPAGSDEHREGVRSVMAGLVQRVIIDEEARACGAPCAVTASDVADERREVIKENFNDSESSFEAFKEQRELTEQDISAILRQELQQEKLSERHGPQPKVSVATARAYYTANRSRYTIPAQRHASHILLETRQEAVALRRQITSDNFRQLARRHSLDADSARRGGLLAGVSGQTGISDEFDQAIAEQAPGAISSPIRSAFGWHLVRITTTQERTPGFAALRERIMRERPQEIAAERLARWQEKVQERWEPRTVYASADLAPLPRFQEPPVTPAPPEPPAPPAVPTPPQPPVPTVPQPAVPVPSPSP